MAKVSAGIKHAQHIPHAKPVATVITSSSGQLPPRRLSSRWAQCCSTAADRQSIAARASKATPTPLCDDISGKASVGVDASWDLSAASVSSWDESCSFQEVCNPLADYESVDAPHTEMQTALLENETYRSLVPLMCWAHLLDKSEREVVPLGTIIGQSTSSESPSPEAVAAAEDSTAWHLPVMQMNASASIWRTLLQDAESQPAWVKASIGMLLYGLGDIIAQAFSHGKVTSATELVSMMALGALFEGVCNPWWNAEINRRIVETGAADAARVKSLRFFLNYLVWTPLCCEFYLVYEHLVTHPFALDFTEVPLLVDALLGVPDATAVELVEELEGFSEGLVDELQSQGVYMMGANALKVWVPPPFRPLFTKVIEAGSWTVLD